MVENNVNLKRIANALAAKYETAVASSGTDLHKIALILEDVAGIEAGPDASDATSLRRIAVALETMNGGPSASTPSIIQEDDDTP